VGDDTPNLRWRHDMKNQLGIILGFSELLLDDLAPDHPMRTDLEEILRAGRRAMKIVNDFEPAGPRLTEGL
jgi:signal transduction histidine kinase